MAGNNGSRKKKEVERVEQLTNETEITFIPRKEGRARKITGRVEKRNGNIYFHYFGSDASHPRIQRSLSPNTKVAL